MTVLGVNHIGFTVADLERSVAFYTRFLGFRHQGDIATVNGPWISQVTSFPRTDLRIAFLTQGDTTLELIQYVSPRGETEVKTTTADVGSAHVAVEVVDIESVTAELREVGIRFVSGPTLVTSGGWQGRKLAYLLDPDGVVAELIEKAPEDGE
jgi:catechol 2,3-dioxygenase-like lactoylglutathione lyase family enzyme